MNLDESIDRFLDAYRRHRADTVANLEWQELIDTLRDPARMQELADQAVDTPIVRFKKRRFGEFELTDLIGAGGMGQVYRAVHPELGRQQALKILPPDRVTNAQAMNRFKREIRAVGQLNHPSIVTVYDAGQVDGTPYLTMELIEGQSLSEVVRDARRDGLDIEVTEACRLIADAADGIQHAHENGVLHRDIKPGNLMLDSQGRVRILDLGLAKFVKISKETAAHLAEIGEAEDENTSLTDDQLTAAQQILGTPDYMSPEQITSVNEVDARTDVYSLAATLHYLLTGEPLFAITGSNLLAKAIAVTQTPAPLASVKRDDLPDGLAETIASALSKNPDDRPSSAAEFATLVRPYATEPAIPLVEQQVQAPPQIAGGSSPPRSRASLWLLALLPIGLLLSGVIFYLQQSGGGMLVVESDDTSIRQQSPLVDEPKVALPKDRSSDETQLSTGSRQASTTLPPSNDLSSAPDRTKNVSSDERLAVGTLEAQALAVLQKKCANCHAGAEREETTGSNLDVTFVSTFRGLIRPGRPDESELLDRIHDKTMPPEGEGDPLTDAESTLVAKWIESLAVSRDKISLQDELQAVVADRQVSVAEGRESDNEFYISLRSLHNRDDVGELEMNQSRFALAKLVNSLHWKPELIMPEAIDQQHTIYRIDIVTLGWNPGKFTDLLLEYPYRVIPEAGSGDANLRRAASHLVRLDWLMKQLTLPTNYHEFLYGNLAIQNTSPKSHTLATLNGLMEVLKVDYDRCFSSGEVMRAFINKGKGASTSEVSRNYRILDRLTSMIGPVWISYDFAESVGEQDVLKSPWGPRSPTRPSKVAFVHNGGEVIFQLPSRLHGYFVVNEKGDRIDTAPVDIVRDTTRAFDDSGAISTGVACIRCHAGGYRSRTVIAPQNLADDVIRLGKRPKVLDQDSLDDVVGSDNQSYLATLREISTRMNVANAAFGDPISAVVKIFDQDLDAYAYASELEQLQPSSPQEIMPALQNALVKNEPLMRDLLGDEVFNRASEILRNGVAATSISREDFDTIFPVIAFKFQLVKSL